VSGATREFFGDDHSCPERRLVALAAHYALPAMYGYRQVVEAGGLISYGGTPLGHIASPALMSAAS
jgi:hypothetical protein